MKKLIFIVGLGLSIQVFATSNIESPFKSRLRDMVANVVGEEWSLKLFGPRPEVEVKEEITLPTLPMNFKKSTNVDSYSKKVKDPTEFDRLPAEKKRHYDYKFIEELYWVTRKEKASEENLSNWLNTLDQGGSREGIYQALVLDETYSALEGNSEKSSAKLKEFVIKFSQKFLNQIIKEESIADLNLFSLKRILTEKGIDLLDYFETKDLDDFYRWYAVLSAEIGKDYGGLMKNQSRSEASVKYHYEWAKAMPIQHIKSEYIIKMHELMNTLQAAQ